MKNPTFYMGFLAVLFLSMLSCQKEVSMNNPNFSLESNTQTIGNASSSSSGNLENVLFEGTIAARRTDAVMSFAFRDLFTKYPNLQAIVYGSRGDYFGLIVMPPAHATYATGYSCPQGAQNCNLENVAILDTRDEARTDGRGIMSWITAMMGFN